MFPRMSTSKHPPIADLIPAPCVGSESTWVNYLVLRSRERNSIFDTAPLDRGQQQSTSLLRALQAARYTIYWPRAFRARDL
jgi:hypothetical protein